MQMIKLWHESDREFTRPDMEHARAERMSRPKGEQRHVNGGLGLYCSAMTVTPAGDIMESPAYGRFLYELTVEAEHIHDMPIGELAKMSQGFYNDEELVARQRARFIYGKVKVLRIIEKDGLCRQAIVVDLDAIKSFTLVPRYAHEHE